MVCQGRGLVVGEEAGAGCVEVGQGVGDFEDGGLGVGEGGDGVEREH